MAKKKKMVEIEVDEEEVVEQPVIKLDLGCGINKAAGFLGVDRRKFDTVDFVCYDLSTSTWVFDGNVGGVCTKITQNVASEPQDGIILDIQLVNEGWVLPDSSVTEVHCSHFLEHLNHNQEDPARVRFMNELYRVLIPGGKATIITPHWCSNRAYGDFTHADKPVSEMFYYYISKAWRELNAPDNDIAWNKNGYKCDFGATWGYSIHPDIQVRHQDTQAFALQFYKEAALDLHATLIANKN